MSDEQRLNQSGLVQSGNRELTTRSSTLVQRGLEALLAQEVRVVCFPSDRSVGALYLYDRGVHWSDVVPGEKIGEARGNVTVRMGKDLFLWVGKEASTDLSPLATLGPNDIQLLNLGGTHISDTSLAYLQDLGALHTLFLHNTQVSDAGLVHLQKLLTLQELFLDNTQVSDAGLVHLQHLPALQRLSLSNTQISDAGLVHLQKLLTLQELFLDNIQVSDASIANLQRALPNCHIRNPVNYLRPDPFMVQMLASLYRQQQKGKG